jgi:formylglycine-generating enzyme required for sulfatase activity
MTVRTTAALGLGLLALGAALSGAWWDPPSRMSPAANSGSACSIAAGNALHPGMIFVAGGNFTMGADYTYPEEAPAHAAEVAGFWMDQTEVTNARFAEFVAATGYVTLAERGISNPDQPMQAPIAGSAVFKPAYDGQQPDPFQPWWQFQRDASWQHPEGPGSDLTGREHHPVVHVSYEDAIAYATWKGHSLPTEEQFEFAARTSSREDRDGNQIANTWQGLFPYQHDSSDGYTGTAPVGCYAANALGLHDLIGNVWEWTSSPYYAAHDFGHKEQFPQGYDPAQPTDAVAVIKGGSWLCAPNYCMRYRPQSRQGQSKGLGTSHIGFRTVLNQ